MPSSAVLRTTVATVVALLLALSGCSGAPGGSEPDGPLRTAAAGGVPNAIVVVVDDMSDFSCAQAHRYLPKSSHWLVDQGRCFENATVTSPVCCPARAQLMTGQMPHNDGVRRQVDASKLDVRDTIQYALRRDGASTYGTGKFLNGIDAVDFVNGRFDTGFGDTDFWNSTTYKTYHLVDDQGHSYKPPTHVHATERAGGYLRTFLDGALARDEPFFAYAAFHAPHTQNGFSEDDPRWFPLPTPANADKPVPPFRWHPERDTSDKLSPFARLAHGKAFFRRLHKVRIQSLYDVDDQLAAAFEQVEAAGKLDTTAVLFVSDNGFSLGENGWEGKAVPYPASIQVPMMAYLPSAFGTGVVDRRQVGLIDIAPTLFELFGLRAGHVMDGHSLLGPVRRTGQYHEFTNERSRFVLEESGGQSPFRVPSWRMYTRGSKALIRYYDRRGRVLAEEFYADRGRLRNLLAPQYAARRPSARTLRQFRAQLRSYATCAGTRESGARRPCP